MVGIQSVKVFSWDAYGAVLENRKVLKEHDDSRKVPGWHAYCYTDREVKVRETVCSRDQDRENPQLLCVTDLGNEQLHYRVQGCSIVMNTELILCAVCVSR